MVDRGRVLPAADLRHALVDDVRQRRVPRAGEARGFHAGRGARPEHVHRGHGRGTGVFGPVVVCGSPPPEYLLFTKTTYLPT